MSTDQAIAGGGGSRTEDGTYVPDLNVWVIAADGTVSALPELPADGIVFGLDGTRVGEALVLTGQECDAEVRQEFLSCYPPRRLSVWTLVGEATEWTRHDLPAAVTAGVVASDDSPTGPASLTTLGSHDDAAVLSLADATQTRFVAFDTESQEFQELGVGAGTSGAVSSPACLTPSRNIVQIRAIGPVGDARSLQAFRLERSGDWLSGPEAVIGSSDDLPATTAGRLSCGEDRTLLTAFVAGRQVLVNIDPAGLTLSLWAEANASLAELPGLEAVQLVDAHSPSRVEVQVRYADGQGIFAIDDQGSLQRIGDLGHPSGDAAFSLDDAVGTVSDGTGAVDVR